MKRFLWIALILAVTVLESNASSDDSKYGDVAPTRVVANRPHEELIPTPKQQVANRRKKINRIEGESSHSEASTIEGEGDDIITSSETIPAVKVKKAKKSNAKKEKQASDIDLTELDIIDNDKYVHFFSAFASSFSLIIVSEIGDKTFFIAAVLAMRHPRLEVFASAISALALMTALSVAAGHILPNILPPVWTHWASMFLFFFFGVKLLKEAYAMDPNHSGKSDELEEVEAEVEKNAGEEEGVALTEGTAPAAASPRGRKAGIYSLFRRCLSPIFIQGFVMTFAAEWGDRSQIATIALAAARDPFGVTIGGILGHAICTAGAVISGKFAAARISERTVNIFGGACFLLCGLYALYSGPDSFAA